ncbi:MAG: ankyrin repeat domain-containing protein [Zoogloeaceae bacterium]|jgi:ankyrin repeat protein|nr:ankyrin repeat domain-containing protein [Zoogloeaceae bacterium]
MKRRLFLILTLAFAAQTAFAGIYDDLLQAIDNDDTATVTAILQRGMDVNAVDKTGNSLLTLAVQKENVDLVRFLLEHRARVQTRNQYGDTPVMLAALKGNIKIVKLLVTAGAELNYPGWTPLLYAAYAGHEEVVDFLIHNGADINAKAPNQATALTLAAQNKHTKVVKLLKLAGAKEE